MVLVYVALMHFECVSNTPTKEHTVATTAQQIIESSTLPDGFEYEAIGFTEDGWILTAPNGAELEFGSSTDDVDDFEGYSWHEYSDGMENGNITDAGGNRSEESARERVNAFISENH